MLAPDQKAAQKPAVPLFVHVIHFGASRQRRLPESDSNVAN